MHLSDSSVSAFTTTAGIAPDKMNLAIRTVLLAITFLWAAWCVYGEVQFFKHHEADVIDMIRKLTRVLVIITLMMILVFI